MELYEIIDVSEWQGDINWAKAASQGIIGAATRATVGSYKDPKCFTNLLGMRVNKLLRTVYTVYVPGDPGDDEYIEMMAGIDLELPPVADLEIFKNKYTGAQADPFEVKKMLEFLEEFHGIRPIVYTNLNFVQNALGTPFWLAEYPLWVASYTFNNPVVPKPWQADDWAIWQWSADKGPTANQDGALYGAESVSIDKNRAKSTFIDQFLNGEEPMSENTNENAPFFSQEQEEQFLRLAEKCEIKIEVFLGDCCETHVSNYNTTTQPPSGGGTTPQPPEPKPTEKNPYGFPLMENTGVVQISETMGVFFIAGYNSQGFPIMDNIDGIQVKKGDQYLVKEPRLDVDGSEDYWEVIGTHNDTSLRGYFLRDTKVKVLWRWSKAQEGQYD